MRCNIWSAYPPPFLSEGHTSRMICDLCDHLGIRCDHHTLRLFSNELECVTTSGSAVTSHFTSSIFGIVGRSTQYQIYPIQKIVMGPFQCSSGPAHVRGCVQVVLGRYGLTAT